MPKWTTELPQIAGHYWVGYTNWRGDLIVSIKNFNYSGGDHGDLGCYEGEQWFSIQDYGYEKFCRIYHPTD